MQIAQSATQPAAAAMTHLAGGQGLQPFNVNITRCLLANRYTCRWHKDTRLAAAAMTHLAASVCVAACVTLFAAAVVPAVLAAAAPASPAAIYGCIRAEVSTACRRGVHRSVKAHDTAARDGQAVYLCMTPGGLTALSSSTEGLRHLHLW